MADIDVGYAKTGCVSTQPAGKTIVCKDNPANATGTITKIWINVSPASAPLLGVQVATFYTTNGNTLSTRDTESIPGNLPAGLNELDVNLDVQVGDYLGMYWTGGGVLYTMGGAPVGCWYLNGDQIPCAGVVFNWWANSDICLYGEGNFPNAAPTAPTSLQIDGQSSPTGANCVVSTPEFSAIYNDPDAGDQSNAIQIQVGSASGLADMWDSGWLADSIVEGNRCAAKTYVGAALSAGTSYWWRCRFRDDDNEIGAWSAWQQFDMCEEEGRTGSGIEATGIGSSESECEPGGSLPKRLAFRCRRKQPRAEPAYQFPS